MIRIQNGKKYNTGTAKMVAEWWNGSHRFDEVRQELYITKKGSWFIKYQGGPMSEYAVSHGRNTSGSSGITVLSKEDVFNWLECHNEVEAIEKYFPEKIEEA